MTPPAWEWTDLVAHATLGTARRPDVPVRDVAGRAVDAPTAEERVLQAAATLWAGQRTSRRALPHGAVADRWAAPPDDDRPVAPDEAAQVLDAILSDVVGRAYRGATLLAWLREASRVGWRLPARLRADVLAAAPTPLPSDVVAVLGPHGRWLAGLGRPAWSAALLDVAGARTLLADGRADEVGPAVRRLWDDAPATGREVVAAGWDGWTSAKREAVLTAVADRVGEEDEGWLEAALADPRAGATAAARLRGLPDSAHASRMAERLAAMVAVARRPLRPAVLEVAEVRPGPADLRDVGLADPTARPAGQGLVGWWQATVLAGAPRRAWERLVGDLASAVRLQARTPAVLPHVVLAATAQRDATWADALLPAVLAHHRAPSTGGPEVPIGLDRQALIRWQGLVAGLLAVLPRPWPAEVTAGVLDWVARHPSPVPALVQLGPLLATAAGPEADAGLEDLRNTGPMADQVRRHAHMVLAARSLHRAIADMAPP